MTVRLLAARLLAVVAVAMTSLVMFGAAPAHACSCVVGNAQQYAERADAVFRGTITNSEGSRSTTAKLVYDVEVDAVFKGEVSRSVTVATSSISSSCGLPNLPEGEPLFFFATGSTNDSLSVNSCDGTGSALVTAQAVTAALGEPREPSTASDRQASPDITNDSGEDGADTAPWLVGGGLLVAAAAGGGVLLRRRRSA